uniref:Uroplakin-2 n=1 Tax=Callorhinchus milii TaxID=7868 RepID=A0A4W3IDR2_CALMI
MMVCFSGDNNPLLVTSICGTLLCFNISLVNDKELVTNTFSRSVIVGLPPCRFISKSVHINVTTGDNPGPLQENFTMIACRFPRDLISIVSSQGGSQQTNHVGVRLTDLNPGTDYNVQFTIDTESSNKLPFRSLNPQDYRNIDVNFRRTGAMVVITVLLVVAMALLIVFLIIALVIKK